jgi:hypothetical protein
LQASSESGTFFDELPMWEELHRRLSMKIAEMRVLQHMHVSEDWVCAQTAMLNKITGALKGERFALHTAPKWDDSNAGTMQK